jgi:hypothetical protein
MMNPNTPRTRRIWQLYGSLVDGKHVDVHDFKLDDFIKLAELSDHMPEMNFHYDCDTYQLTFHPALFDVIKNSCDPNEYTCHLMYYISLIADMNVPKSRKVNEHLLSMFKKQINMGRYHVVENNLCLLAELYDNDLNSRVDAYNISLSDFNADKTIGNEQICDDYLAEIMRYISAM